MNRLASAAMLGAALAAAPSPLAAQDALPVLSEAQARAFDCGVVLGLAVRARAEGASWAAPVDDAVEPRAREFFVRTSAQVMDELQIERPALLALTADSVRRMGAPGAAEGALPGCLAALEASGL